MNYLTNESFIKLGVSKTTIKKNLFAQRNKDINKIKKELGWLCIIKISVTHKYLFSQENPMKNQTKMKKKDSSPPERQI